ncbi:hypothetical protein MKZ38_010540 [Zalerion maritima]|uniref:Uncharacterized protein n=1 Tax=Zalerion maritima TaxID=339359 RepID=A0AAD5RS67_9PEZI|nr:hypothetical protein MKZ38_010540 [Zalerion maritima]
MKTLQVATLIASLFLGFILANSVNTSPLSFSVAPGGEIDRRESNNPTARNIKCFENKALGASRKWTYKNADDIRDDKTGWFYERDGCWADPGHCEWLACQHDSAVYVCNWNHDGKRVTPKCGDVANGAGIIANTCDDPIAGEYFGEGIPNKGWSVRVEHLGC